MLRLGRKYLEIQLSNDAIVFLVIKNPYPRCDSVEYVGLVVVDEVVEGYWGQDVGIWKVVRFE